MKKPALLLVTLISLQACSSAPIVDPRPAVTPPKPPPLAKEPLGPSFQDRMRDFLQGKLPEPIINAQPLQPAIMPTTR